MTAVKVAINGFGRIGRLSFRAHLKNKKINIVAINDLAPIDQATHLLKWDSVYGKINHEISHDEENIYIDGTPIKYTQIKDPTQLPWKELNIDIVLECTGIFRTRELASKHLEAGAKKVILSAPGKGEIPTFCYGINHQKFNPDRQTIISNASCTTNCIAPVAKVIDDNFQIINGFMTTVHAYTNNQVLADSFHKKDNRRARAAAQSIIPTSTGAAKALGLVLPNLQGKILGSALRVPTPTVSLVELICNIKTPTTIEDINFVLEKASQNSLKGVLAVSHEPLVSRDYTGNPHSSIVDAELTECIEKHTIKVVAWYDNEWGYSERLINMAEYVAQQMYS
jgi:glyceraldehyde 3-phosphate dehydrogenase